MTDREMRKIADEITALSTSGELRTFTVADAEPVANGAWVDVGIKRGPVPSEADFIHDEQVIKRVGDKIYIHDALPTYLY